MIVVGENAGNTENFKCPACDKSLSLDFYDNPSAGYWTDNCPECGYTFSFWTEPVCNVIVDARKF
jgi:ssDNA-binding Zn-finger/Zn-ribbon topoisomerase 1